MKCDTACSGCTGIGSDKCLQCNKGFRKVEESCLDIDECQEGLAQCQSHQKCVNKHGTYDCIGKHKIPFELFNFSSSFT